MGPRVRAWVWQWRRGSSSQRSGSRPPLGGGWDSYETYVRENKSKIIPKEFAFIMYRLWDWKGNEPIYTDFSCCYLSVSMVTESQWLCMLAVRTSRTLVNWWDSSRAIVATGDDRCSFISLLKAQHAQENGAAAIGLMPTTFFKPATIGNVPGLNFKPCL